MTTPRPCCGSDHTGPEHGPDCALPHEPTSESPETIDVFACITPAGQLAFATDADDARQVARNWHESLTDEQREQHEAAGTMGGFVRMRMLRSDYAALKAES